MASKNQGYRVVRVQGVHKDHRRPISRWISKDQALAMLAGVKAVSPARGDRFAVESRRGALYNLGAGQVW